MQDSGGAMVAVFGMLITSAVAIFFSWSGATDLSDLWVQFFLLRAPVSETTSGFPVGRSSAVNVMTIRPLSWAPCCPP